VPGKLPGKVEDVAYLGPAKAVDGLVVIAHDAQIGFRAREGLEDSYWATFESWYSSTSMQENRARVRSRTSPFSLRMRRGRRIRSPKSTFPMARSFASYSA
jgi:hypothetical protein